MFIKSLITMALLVSFSATANELYTSEQFNEEYPKPISVELFKTTAIKKPMAEQIVKYISEVRTIQDATAKACIENGDLNSSICYKAVTVNSDTYLDDMFSEPRPKNRWNIGDIIAVAVPNSGVGYIPLIGLGKAFEQTSCGQGNSKIPEVDVICKTVVNRYERKDWKRIQAQLDIMYGMKTPMDAYKESFNRESENEQH